MLDQTNDCWQGWTLKKVEGFWNTEEITDEDVEEGRKDGWKCANGIQKPFINQSTRRFKVCTSTSEKSNGRKDLFQDEVDNNILPSPAIFRW